MSSEGVSEIDIWPEFQNLTGDVISKTAFGSSYQEGRRIFQLQAELAERLIQSFQTIFIPGYWLVLFPSNSNIFHLFCVKIQKLANLSLCES